MSSDQEDFDAKKKELIDNFLSNDHDSSDIERDKAFELFCIDLIILQYGITDISTDDFKKISTYTKEKMAAMECNDPRLAHAVNGLNKIGKSKYGEASNYIEELLKSMKEEISKLQTERANNPRPDALNDLIMSYLRFKPDMTSGEVLQRLNSDIGNGVVDEISGGEIYYVQNRKNGEMPEIAKVSGLKNRLSRLKNNIN